jgi:hypothetical protein
MSKPSFDPLSDPSFDSSSNLSSKPSSRTAFKPTLKPAGEDIDDRLGVLNQTYAIVRWNSQTLIMNERFESDNKRILSFMTKDSFLLWQKNNIFWQENNDGSVKPVELGTAWLKWPNRRQYIDVTFAPNAVERPETYNLWSGFSFEPSVEGSCVIFLDHLLKNVCQNNQEYYHWIMSWMADLVQKPERKIGTALVLRGEMGVGKSVVFRHLGALMAMHYLTVQKTEHVTGRFNGHLVDKLLIFLDEAFWAGNKEAESSLKTLVSEDGVAVELKGKDLYYMRSYIRIGMSTNSDWSVPTGLRDERRFAVFDVGDAVKQNHEYFALMEKELMNGGYAKLLHTLLNYQYDPYAVAVIPKTEALLEQKMFSMSHELRWWSTCLNDQRVATVESVGWPLKISREEFYNSYLDYCKKMNVRYPVSKQWLMRTLQKKNIQIKHPKDRREGYMWVYDMYDLETCRKSFEEALGHTIPWDT